MIMKTDWNNGKLVCGKCGANENIVMDIVYTNDHTELDKIIVIGKKERKLKTLPQTKITCPKCNNTEAYWWMVQTRSADESTTQFFRCTKCENTWREYS
jgi:DNA-directed RNA polymerase subunit M